MAAIRKASAAIVFGTLMLTGCDEIPRGSKERNNLASMRTVQIKVGGKTVYTAYVANTSETERLGLMNVTEAELPTDRGMIFIFPYDRLLSFWMRNTIIPLDIAYIRSDGTIVKTYTMEPLKEFGYSSIEPARFALELRAGQLAHWSIKEGDHVEIPPELFD